MSVRKNDAGLYEVEIDGTKYEFEKWGAEDATDALLDIAGIVGKPLGMGVAALFGRDEDGKAGMDKKLDPDAIGKVMEALSGQVGANKAIVKGLIKKLASEKVIANGAKITSFNTYYSDRMSHLMKVVRAGLEVQYGNFFGEILGASGVSLPQSLMNKAQT